MQGSKRDESICWEAFVCKVTREIDQSLVGSAVVDCTGEASTDKADCSCSRKTIDSSEDVLVET